MSEKKPEIIKTLSKDVKADMVVQVPAERAKVLKVEPLSKSMPTMSKGVLKIDFEMISGINKGNKGSFVTKEDDKLDVVPEVKNLWDRLFTAGIGILIGTFGALCYGMFAQGLGI